MNKLESRITALYANPKPKYSEEDKAIFEDFVQALNKGEIRACYKENSLWKVNRWIKKGILLGFRLGVLQEYNAGELWHFFDKDTLPLKSIRLEDQIRIVPGGSSIRSGCFIAKGVTLMPPAYINIGAWVDEHTMVDSHTLVGSCAQIGKRVHLSAGAMIGGVLEPIGSRPVIIEDDAFIGGNSGIYEGIIVSERVVIASGTIMNNSTPVYDSVAGNFLPRDEDGSFTIPPNAVVVPGSRRLRQNPDFQVYCPIIIKYRDAKTDAALALECELRNALE
ncbi:MAG: 2,3,4,5-tetrahydropyridine-2,6-dicarboxylate N-succinyltransferase [Candidatus Cloacimonadota bacterium]|nr:2,3,4,5-tetrahydropyridine-2,6-dicarboxylate N-succinyltransferase [Candidatus Cloacimonadota bacterium]